MRSGAIKLIPVRYITIVHGFLFYGPPLPSLIPLTVKEYCPDNLQVNINGRWYRALKSSPVTTA